VGVACRDQHHEATLQDKCIVRHAACGTVKVSRPWLGFVCVTAAARHAVSPCGTLSLCCIAVWHTFKCAALHFIVLHGATPHC
jgi:hypothetical protein